MGDGFSVRFFTFSASFLFSSFLIRGGFFFSKRKNKSEVSMEATDTTIADSIDSAI